MRAYFNTRLEDCPAFSDRLDADEHTVFSHLFEFGLLQVQELHEESLTLGERQELQGLLLRRDGTIEVASLGASIIESAGKCLRKSGGVQELLYVDTRFLLPKSNKYEQFFSISEFALTNRRKRLFPSNFESQLFLCMNRDFWNVDNVRQLVEE